MPSLLAYLGLNISSFQRGLGQATSQAAGAGKRIGSSLGSELSGQLKSIAGTGAVMAGIGEAVKYGSHISDLADRLGVSTDALQEWDYALKMNGGSVDDAAKFFEKLAVSRQKAMSGDEGQIEAFRRLGVSMDDLKNKRLEDIGAQIGRAFENGDPQQLISYLREVGGKGAGDLVTMFAAGFDDIAKQAHDLGIIIAEETISGLDAFGDQMDSLKQRMIATLAPIGSILGDILAGVLDGGQTLMNAAVTLLRTGSIQAAKEVAEETAKEFEDRDKKAADAKAKKKPGVGGFSEDGTEDKKSGKALDELAKKTEANNLAQMTSQEKLIYLSRKRAAIASAMGGMTKEGKLNAALDIADLDKDIWNEGKTAAGGKKAIHAEANSLQKIGARGAAPEMILLDVNQKQERHLEAIRRDIAKMVNRNPSNAAGNVMF